MLKRIEEFGKYVELAGFRNVKIKNVEEFLQTANRKISPEVEVQFFDARLVAGWEHLYFAGLNALTAFKNRDNISKSWSMEALLYAAGQRQITKATELMGIKLDSSGVALLIIGKNTKNIESVLSAISKTIGGQRDDSILELSREKESMVRRAFKISGTELEAVMEEGDRCRALSDLVIEKMALLATQH